jgi:hypothetical protein
VAQVIRDLTEQARSANVDETLKEAGRAIEAHRLGLALNAFRRAADLSVGSERLRRRVFDRFAGWRRYCNQHRLALGGVHAATGGGLNVGWQALAQIWQPTERELCEEYIRSVLAEASRSDRWRICRGFEGV